MCCLVYIIHTYHVWLVSIFVTLSYSLFLLPSYISHLYLFCLCLFFFFKQKTAYEMRISDWSSDVCSSDLPDAGEAGVAARGAVIRADADEAVDAAFGLGVAIRILALEQQRRGFDPRLFARMLVDQFDLHAVAFGPARVHALEHPGPILALGAARAGIDLDIGVVGVGLTREQRLDLAFIGTPRERGQVLGALGRHFLVAFRLGKLDQFGGVGKLVLDGAGRGDRLVEPLALAHHRLGELGIVPQRLILDARVEFIEAAERAIPIEEAAEQRQRLVDRIDMGLRFGAHG